LEIGGGEARGGPRRASDLECKKEKTVKSLGRKGLYCFKKSIVELPLTSGESYRTLLATLRWFAYDFDSPIRGYTDECQCSACMLPYRACNPYWNLTRSV